jgi:hypothetical protein
MTTLKRTLLATSLAAAGLFGSAGLSQAADLDVSQIYGRGSPPNAHITQGPNYHAASDASWQQAAAARGDAADREPVRSSAVDSDGETGSRMSQAATGDYATAPDTTAAATQTVTPSGRYLEVEESTRPQRAQTAVIHEESLDGVPLVDGRGVREGYDLHAADVVSSDAAFDVADVLGRASPPAPADAPNYGLPQTHAAASQAAHDVSDVMGRASSPDGSHV